MPREPHVPGEGVEPSRAEAHGFLRPARLPIPPSRRGTFAQVSLQVGSGRNAPKGRSGAQMVPPTLGAGPRIEGDMRDMLEA
jgi:hypothetical protein